MAKMAGHVARMEKQEFGYIFDGKISREENTYKDQHVDELILQ